MQEKTSVTQRMPLRLINPSNGVHSFPPSISTDFPTEKALREYQIKTRLGCTQPPPRFIWHVCVSYNPIVNQPLGMEVILFFFFFFACFFGGWGFHSVTKKWHKPLENTASDANVSCMLASNCHTSAVRSMRTL